jgi:hypothetical protein
VHGARCKARRRTGEGGGGGGGGGGVGGGRDDGGAAGGSERVSGAGEGGVRLEERGDARSLYISLGRGLFSFLDSRNVSEIEERMASSSRR